MPSPRRTRRASLQADQVSELKLLIKESRNEIIGVLKEDLNCIKEKLESLTSRITDVEATVQSIQKDHAKVVSEIDDVKKETLSACEASSRLVMSEIDGRLSRLTNIIIRGLPERDGNVLERTRHDLDCIHKKIRIIEPNASIEVSDVKRLGKLSIDRPRLLRVSLPSANCKQQILRKAKLLRNTCFKDVFIQPDLTKMQQVVDRDLRKELSVRRQRGEDVVIYDGEVRERSKNFHQ